MPTKEVFSLGTAYSTSDVRGSDVGMYAGLVMVQVRDEKLRPVTHAEVRELEKMLQEINEKILRHGSKEPKYVSFEAIDNRVKDDGDYRDDFYSDAGYVLVRLRYKDVCALVREARRSGLLR